MHYLFVLESLPLAVLGGDAASIARRWRLWLLWLRVGIHSIHNHMTLTKHVFRPRMPAIDNRACSNNYVQEFFVVSISNGQACSVDHDHWCSRAMLAIRAARADGRHRIGGTWFISLRYWGLHEKMAANTGKRMRHDCVTLEVLNLNRLMIKKRHNSDGKLSRAASQHRSKIVIILLQPWHLKLRR